MDNNLSYLNALVNGDSRKIKALYVECFPMIKNFVIQNKGNIEDAEDIFQKSLLQLSVRFRKEKFTIHTSFEAYLFTVCKNLWRRELNKSKNVVTKEPILEQRDESEDMTLALIEQKRWELFNESIDLISDNCKEVLKMFFARIPYSEIVVRMDYSSETVARQRVFKCKAKLKDVVINDKRFNFLKVV